MSTASSSPLVPGDLVLVTGATGFIGSHVVEEALKAGLRVRATARTEAKASKLRQHFASLYDADRLDLVLVPDTSTPGAFDGILHGVHGVAHIASPLEFSLSWSVVTTAVKSTVALLRAAQEQPSVRRVVLTSSSVVLGHPRYDAPTTYTPETWDDSAVAEARQHPTPLGLYTASKYEAEKALWDFVRTERPAYTVATVNPTMTYGREVPGASTASTNAALLAFARGDLESIAFYNGAHFFVNVQNVAQLHVEAMANPSVGNERLLAYHQTTYTYRDLVRAILSSWPDAPLASAHWEAMPDLDAKDMSSVDNSRMQELLRGRIIDLNDTVKQALASASNATN